MSAVLGLSHAPAGLDMGLSSYCQYWHLVSWQMLAGCLFASSNIKSSYVSSLIKRELETLILIQTENKLCQFNEFISFLLSWADLCYPIYRDQLETRA